MHFKNYLHRIMYEFSFSSLHLFYTPFISGFSLNFSYSNFPSDTALILEGVTIQNCANGVIARDRLDVISSFFFNNEKGIYGISATHINLQSTITSSSFSFNHYHVFSGTSNITIQSSNFSFSTFPPVSSRFLSSSNNRYISNNANNDYLIFTGGALNSRFDYFENNTALRIFNFFWSYGIVEGRFLLIIEERILLVWEPSLSLPVLSLIMPSLDAFLIPFPPLLLKLPTVILKTTLVSSLMLGMVKKLIRFDSNNVTYHKGEIIRPYVFYGGNLIITSSTFSHNQSPNNDLIGQQCN